MCPSLARLSSIFTAILANRNREIAQWPTPTLDFRIEGMSYALSEVDIEGWKCIACGDTDEMELWSVIVQTR